MTAQLPSREMLAQAIERISDAIDDAARLYGENWDSALVGGEPNYHAITSDHTQGIVVKTDDDSLHSSWLCDYLEAVDPASIRLLLARIKELDKAAHEQEPVAVVEPSDYVTAAQISDDKPRKMAVRELYEGALIVGQNLYAHPALVPAVPMAVAGFDAATAIRACMEEFPESMHDIVEECAQIAENTISINHAKSAPAVPAGYVLVPVEPTITILDEIDAIFDFGAEDSKDAWHRLLAAAPKVAHFRENENSSTKLFREIGETSTKCWCRTCRPVTLGDMRFVVCPDCGNKRCHKANDHRNACTGSNEPGQPGSTYPDAPKGV